MRRSLVLLAALWACAGDGGAPSGTPAPWSLAAEPDLVIGLQAGAPEYLFQRVAGVRRLGDGRIVVADRGHSTVRVFDATGRHVVTLGGEGQGPGEFSWIGHLSVRGPDTLVVYDAGLYRITRMLTTGALIGTTSIRDAGAGPELYVGTYANGDAALAWIGEAGGTPDEPRPDRWRIGRYEADGALLAEVGAAVGMRRMDRGPVPFSPFLHAFLVRDSVVHTDGQDATLHVLGADGTRVREITVDMPRAEPRRAWATLRAELARRGESRQLEWTPDAPESAPLPQVAEVLLDDLERFWLKGYDPATDSHLLGGWEGARGGAWTVVNRDGDVVARVTLPDHFVPHHVGADHILGVTRDELGVERVAVYRYGPGREGPRP